MLNQLGCILRVAICWGNDLILVREDPYFRVKNNQHSHVPDSALSVYSLDTQSAVRAPAAFAAPGSMLETQNHIYWGQHLLVWPDVPASSDKYSFYWKDFIFLICKMTTYSVKDFSQYKSNREENVSHNKQLKRHTHIWRVPSSVFTTLTYMKESV